MLKDILICPSTFSSLAAFDFADFGMLLHDCDGPGGTVRE